ncbi:MAG: hypothetical protein JKY54_08385 [Flavobacteriales bacterium]|nr:hypothetical protein [Flavobacteriales bacterium]
MKNPNSLEGVPFGKRLYVGGDLGLSFGNYTVINVAPIVGYKLNRKWSTGVGVKYIYYRENFPSLGWDYSTSMYGGSVFTKYLLNSIILHAELETLNAEVREYLSIDVTRKWIPMGFVGVGYRQGLGGTYLQLMALYDVIDNRHSPYRSQYIFGPQLPIIIRGGIVIGLGGQWPSTTSNRLD